MKKRKKNHYKFTHKKKSIRGIFAILFSIVSAVIFVLTVMESFACKGEGSVYLGSFGVLSLLFSLAAFVFAVLAVREKDTYRALPYTGLGLSVIVLLIWTAVYMAGFLF